MEKPYHAVCKCKTGRLLQCLMADNRPHGSFYIYRACKAKLTSYTIQRCGSICWHGDVNTDLLQDVEGKPIGDVQQEAKALDSFMTSVIMSGFSSGQDLPSRKVPLGSRRESCETCYIKLHFLQQWT